jgi:hypothetical protein
VSFLVGVAGAAPKGVEPEEKGGSAEADDAALSDEDGTNLDDDDCYSAEEDEGTEETQGDDEDHCPICGWCTASEMICCDTPMCAQWYHVHCLKLTDAELPPKWLCPECVKDHEEL